MTMEDQSEETPEYTMCSPYSKGSGKEALIRVKTHKKVLPMSCSMIFSVRCSMVGVTSIYNQYMTPI